MEEDKNFMGLIELVKDWGREKKIDNPIMQFAKVNEEVGEIAHELTRSRLQSPELVDAIGDTLVTIIILADILDIDLYDALSEAYDTIATRVGETKNGSFVKKTK